MAPSGRFRLSHSVRAAAVGMSAFFLRRDAERDHRGLPSLRRLVVQDGADERVADGIRAIGPVRQHEAARILQDVLGIRQVQCFAVLEERQRLIADEAGQRRALEQAIARRHGFDGGEKS